jgi:hypothetical protein
MTLTEAAFWTKRFGVIAAGAFAVFVIVILAVTLRAADEMPPQYMTANFACTQTREEFLEHKLEIPSLKLADGSEMVFEINTDSGKIDSLPQIINVYSFDNPVQALSAQADAKILAKKLGFDPDAIIRRGTQSYVWVDRERNQTLEVEAKNLNFSLKTDPAFIRQMAREASLPSEQEAKSKAANALRSLGLYPEDYSTGNHQTTLIKVNPDGSYSKATALADAQLVRVDFVRNKSMITIPSNIVGAESMVQTLSRKLPEEPISETRIVNDEKLIVYTFNTLVSFPNTQRANISVYIGVDNKDNTVTTLSSVYQIEYTFWPIYPESCGTYELISPQVAIEKVQSGEGSLVYLFENGGDDVIEYVPRRVKKFSVLDVYLVYYEDWEELEYLQPVYAISGEVIFDNDIKGSFDYFYPAINYEIVQDKIEQPKPEVIEESGGLL